MFFKIAKIKFKLLVRLIMQKGFEHWAKTIVAVFVIGGFFYGVYFIFYKIFKYLTSVQDIGYALSDRLISLGFLAFFTMLLISNIISSISTLFRSRETRYLMATPLNKNQVFWVRFINNFFFSSWATLVIGLPMAISYMVTNTMSIWYIVWVFGALMLFLIIPAFIGSIISMLFMPAVKKFSFKWSVVTLIGITSIIAYFYVRSNLSGGLMFNVLGDMTMLNYYFRQLGSHRTPFFPHIWFTEIISALRQGQSMRAFLFSSALASTTFFGFFITDYVSKKIFQTSFEAAETMTHKKQSKSTSLHNSKLQRLTFSEQLNDYYNCDRDISYEYRISQLEYGTRHTLPNFRGVKSNANSKFRRRNDCGPSIINLCWTNCNITSYAHVQIHFIRNLWETTPHWRDCNYGRIFNYLEFNYNNTSYEIRSESNR